MDVKGVDSYEMKSSCAHRLTSDAGSEGVLNHSMQATSCGITAANSYLCRSKSTSKKSKDKKSSKSKSSSKKKRRREDSPRASKHSKAAAKDTDVEVCGNLQWRVCTAVSFNSSGGRSLAACFWHAPSLQKDFCRGTSATVGGLNTQAAASLLPCRQHMHDLLQGVIKEGFGAHGILRETDMYAKRAEFQAWAIDVQKVDVEIMCVCAAPAAVLAHSDSDSLTYVSLSPFHHTPLHISTICACTKVCETCH